MRLVERQAPRALFRARERTSDDPDGASQRGVGGKAKTVGKSVLLVSLLVVLVAGRTPSLPSLLLFLPIGRIGPRGEREGRKTNTALPRRGKLDETKGNGTCLPEGIPPGPLGAAVRRL